MSKPPASHQKRSDSVPAVPVSVLKSSSTNIPSSSPAEHHHVAFSENVMSSPSPTLVGAGSRSHPREQEEQDPQRLSITTTLPSQSITGAQSQVLVQALEKDGQSNAVTTSPDSDDVDSADTIVPSRNQPPETVPQEQRTTMTTTTDTHSTGMLSHMANQFTESIINPAKSIITDVSNYYRRKIYGFMVSRRDPKKHYRYLMDAANCYEQWAAAGYMLDRHEGKDKWKNEEKSDYYDHGLVRDRLDMLRSVRKAGDVKVMHFSLRTALTRNLGEMGNPKLYAHTHVGTKLLIEDYIDEVTKQLNFICDVNVPELNLKEKLQFFTDTQKSFGRTALLLSGGGAFGLSHTGVAKALFELKLLPRVITGSSAGAIVAAAICTRTDEELPYLLDPYNIQLVTSDVFEKPEEAANPLIRIARFLKHGVFFDIQVLSDGMRENLGDITFLEAFNRTRRILNITVSSSTTFEMPRLLNYLTAPNVLIWSAVAASCALPFVFRSAPLIAKDKYGAFTPWNPTGHRCIDGSLEGDLPMQRISELFGVNHFIVAQVNPHIIPFFSTGNELPSLTGEIIRNVGHLAIQELHHRLTQLADFGISWEMLHRLKTILSQKYYGDITIVPSIPWSKYPSLLTNPTRASYIGYTIDGERATWPQIAIARNHLQIEMCLNQNLISIREKMVTASKWVLDPTTLLRKHYPGTPAFSTLTLNTNTSANENDQDDAGRDRQVQFENLRGHHRALTNQPYLSNLTTGTGLRHLSGPTRQESQISVVVDTRDGSRSTVSFTMGSPLTPGSADAIQADPAGPTQDLNLLISEAFARLSDSSPREFEPELLPHHDSAGGIVEQDVTGLGILTQLAQEEAERLEERELQQVSQPSTVSFNGRGSDVTGPIQEAFSVTLPEDQHTTHVSQVSEDENATRRRSLFFDMVANHFQQGHEPPTSHAQSYSSTLRLQQQLRERRQESSSGSSTGTGGESRLRRVTQSAAELNVHRRASLRAPADDSPLSQSLPQQQPNPNRLHSNADPASQVTPSFLTGSRRVVRRPTLTGEELLTDGLMPSTSHHVIHHSSESSANSSHRSSNEPMNRE